MAALTLAVAPVLILLVFEFRFLPFHSPYVTWAHRLFILIDLAAVLLLWPAVRDPARNVSWLVLARSWTVHPFALALLVLSFIVLTFPGEPHAAWTRSLPKPQEPAHAGWPARTPTGGAIPPWWAPGSRWLVARDGPGPSRSDRRP
jgi:hypothetical protein